MAKKNGRKKESAAKGEKGKEAAKTIKSNTMVCQICGRKSDNPVDAMTHLLDHGSSALEGVSKLIKDQKDGRVSKMERDESKKGIKGSVDVVEMQG